MLNNIEICNARKLFLNKGILKRDLISDKIIYSWVRSKLHNISSEILDLKNKNISFDISSINIETSKLINYLRNTKSKNSNIYILDFKGNIIYSHVDNSLLLPNFVNFSEEVIGTNAIGISILTNDNIKVLGCEHYNDLLLEIITESIIINDTIVGVMSLISNNEDHDKLCLDLKKNLIFNEFEINNIITKNLIEEEILNEEVSHNKLGLTAGNDFGDTSNSNECKVFTLSIIEKRTIIEALKYYSWNLQKTSKVLGIGRSTLYRKLKYYKIEKEID